MKICAIFLVIFLQNAVCIDPFGTDYWMHKDFKTLVQVTDSTMSNGNIITIEEYFTNRQDSEWDNKAAGAMKIHSDLGHFHYVYRPYNRDAFYVNLNDETSMCVSYKLDDPVPGLDKDLQWKWIADARDFHVVGPTSAVAHLQEMGARYECANKAAIIRGIKTTNCSFYLEGVSSDDLAITAFFEMDERMPSTMKSQQVVRLSLKGKYTRGSDFIDINLDYDFINIDDKINEVDRKFLNIPIGRGCNGTNEFKPSSFSEGFSVNGEVLVKKDTHSTVGDKLLPAVSSFNLVYDTEYGSYGLLQDNFYVKDGQVFGAGTNYTVVIENKGYKFTTNLEEEICYVTTDDSKALALSLPNGEVLHYAGAKSMFNFTDFKYLGVVKYRGIFTKVFEKKVEDLSGLMYISSMYQPGAILTYYELGHSTYQQSSESYYMSTPIALEIRMLNSQLEKDAKVVKLITVNYREYEELGVSVGGANRISIRHCLDSAETRTWFQTTYSGYRATYLVSRREDDLRDQFISHMNNIANINPLRVIHSTFSFQAYSFKITSALLERPSPFVDFEDKKENVEFPEHTKNVFTHEFVLTEEKCAQMCLEVDTDDLCTSYVWCDFTCYIYKGKKQPVPTKVDSKEKVKCAYRKRNYNSLMGNDMVFNEEVIATLQENLMDLNPPFIQTSMNLSVREPYFKASYGLTKVNIDLPENVNSMTERTSYDHHFKLLKDGYTFSGKYIDRDYTSHTDSVYTSYYDCLQQCLNEPDFYCEAFSYCGQHSSCLLSRTNLELDSKNETDKALEERTDCFVFTRTYVEDYKEYKGFVIAEGGKKVKAKNANACAKLCDDSNADGHICESFDMCAEGDSDKAYCTLHKKHFLELKSSKEISISDECNHYSKIFMKDYQRHGKYSLTKQAVYMELKQISVENCSKTCSELEECTGFDYCSGTMSPFSDCHLTKNVTTDKGVLVVAPLCKFYDKIYDRSGNRVHPKPPAISPAQADTGKRNGMTDGAIGGVAFVMIALGIVISAGVLFAFFRYRSRAGY